MSAVYMGRAHKFGAKRCVEHTPAHHSLKECRRWKELQLLERAGEIRDLRQQVRLNLCEAINGDCAHKRPLVYVCDFVYWERCGGRDEFQQVYEDTTGVMLETKRMKVHLLADQGIEVRIT